MEYNTSTPDLIDDKPDEVKSDLRKFNKAEDQVNKALAALSTIKNIKDQPGVDNAMDLMKKADKVEKLIEEKRKSLVKPYNDEVKRINDYARTLTAKIPPAIKLAKDEVLAFHEAEKKRIKDLTTNAREKQLIEMGYSRHPQGTDSVKGNVYVNNDQYISRFTVENYTDENWANLLQIMADQLAAKKQQQIADLKLEKDVAEFFGDNEEKATIDEKIEKIQSTPAPVSTSHVPAFGSAKVKGLTKRWTFEITNITEIPREYLQVDEKKIREAISTGVRTIPGVRIYQDESISLR